MASRKPLRQISPNTQLSRKRTVSFSESSVTRDYNLADPPQTLGIPSAVLTKFESSSPSNDYHLLLPSRFVAPNFALIDDEEICFGANEAPSLQAIHDIRKSNSSGNNRVSLVTQLRVVGGWQPYLSTQPTLSSSGTRNESDDELMLLAEQVERALLSDVEELPTLYEETTASNEQILYEATEVLDDDELTQVLTEEIDDDVFVPVSPDSNLENYLIRSFYSSSSSSSKWTLVGHHHELQGKMEDGNSHDSNRRGSNQFVDDVTLAVQGVFSLLSLQQHPRKGQNELTTLKNDSMVSKRLVELAEVILRGAEMPLALEENEKHQDDKQQLVQCHEERIISFVNVQPEEDSFAMTGEFAGNYDSYLEPPNFVDDVLHETVRWSNVENVPPVAQKRKTWAMLHKPIIEPCNLPRIQGQHQLKLIKPDPSPKPYIKFGPSKVIINKNNTQQLLLPTKKMKTSPLASSTWLRFGHRQQQNNAISKLLQHKDDLELNIFNIPNVTESGLWWVSG